jgi:hypothetical protein
MEKFKLFLALIVIVASSVLAVAKFLLVELHDFWRFLQHLR